MLLAQYSAFPQVGADVYEDVVSSVAILSTGCPRWALSFHNWMPSTIHISQKDLRESPVFNLGIFVGPTFTGLDRKIDSFNYEGAITIDSWWVFGPLIFTGPDVKILVISNKPNCNVSVKVHKTIWISWDPIFYTRCIANQYTMTVPVDSIVCTVDFAL